MVSPPSFVYTFCKDVVQVIVLGSLVIVLVIWVSTRICTIIYLCKNYSLYKVFMQVLCRISVVGVAIRIL